MREISKIKLNNVSESSSDKVAVECVSIFFMRQYLYDCRLPSGLPLFEYWRDQKREWILLESELEAVC